jgi:acyl-CoA synthetase (AMP-forming)/AMP-acid ligase II
LPIISAIAENAGATLILTELRNAPEQRHLVLPDVLGRLKWILTDEIAPDSANDWRKPAINPSSAAYLQYTSGSTSLPKGVVISHQNAMAQCRADSRAWKTDRDSCMVSWLPHFHDFGLVFGILQPLFAGFPTFLMPPAAFVQRPCRWLRAIAEFKATHSGAPNFAFDLCSEKITELEISNMRLETWTMAPVGAEPVRESTLQRFANRFSSVGFEASAFCPSYGLAETTLRVTCGSWSRKREADRPGAIAATSNNQMPPDKADVITTISCGRPEPGTTVIIVDPVSLSPIASGIGEVWVRGETVAQGYWRDSAKTKETFHATPCGSNERFLRTGDLGFFQGGELHICGRLKDVIIAHGINIYPQDIEEAVEESHSSIRRGQSIAFSVSNPAEEKIVVVAEVHRLCVEPALHAQIMQLARKAIALKCEVTVSEIRLVRSDTIPRTSSGKKQRSRCKDLYANDQLDVIAASTLRN